MAMGWFSIRMIYAKGGMEMQIVSLRPDVIVEVEVQDMIIVEGEARHQDTKRGEGIVVGRIEGEVSRSLIGGGIEVDGQLCNCYSV